MHPIFIKLQTFLEKCNKSDVDINEKLFVEFGKKCEGILRNQFASKRKKEFNLYMSNVGKPSCQLQMEALGAKAEPLAYNHKVRNTYGDLTEALVIFLLKASGQNVKGEQRAVTLDIGSKTLRGKIDVEIDNEVYDIKSVSGFAFKNKFGPTCSFNTVVDGDAFGYTAQGFLYGWADEKPFGGWIVINKETGELNVIGTPEFTDEIQEKTHKTIVDNIKAVDTLENFTRCFEDIPETFRRKETGNKTLGFVCSYCPYKKPCWGDVQYRPQINSESNNPKWVYYTHIEEKEKNDA